MSELIAGGAPVAESAEAPVVETAVVPEAPKADPLSKVIEQARMERQRASQRETEAKEAKGQVESLRAEVEGLKKSQAFEDDPVAYGKARGWSPETQAMIGQILLYDLVPDKAPQDLRLRLFEMRQARKEAEQTKQQSEAQARSAREQNEQQLAQYAGFIKDSIPTFDYGSLPESEAYYGDDHDTYQRSLMATAMNLANAAKSAGQSADLSPANVARVLEAEVARRMSVRDQRIAARKPKQVIPSESAGKEQLPETESVRGMTGNGTPQKKAETDAERLQRAIAAGFRSK